MAPSRHWHGHRDSEAVPCLGYGQVQRVGLVGVGHALDLSFFRGCRVSPAIILRMPDPTSPCSMRPSSSELKGNPELQICSHGAKPIPRWIGTRWSFVATDEVSQPIEIQSS